MVDMNMGRDYQPGCLEQVGAGESKSVTERKFSESFDTPQNKPNVLTYSLDIADQLRLRKLEEKVKNQRYELRRLNQQIFRTKFLESEIKRLEEDNITLAMMLDREEQESAHDTDPSELAQPCCHGSPVTHPDLDVPMQWKPEDVFPTQSVNIISVGQSGGINVGRSETYEQWDMRTRFSSGGPRQ